MQRSFQTSKTFCLLFFAFAYSIPNPVYTIKDCFEKIYNVNGNPEPQRPVEVDREDLIKGYEPKEFSEEFLARLD